MEKKIDVDEVRNRRMTDHITPEELRRLVSVRDDEPTVRDAECRVAENRPALPVRITDAEVEAAARVIAGLAPGEEWPSNEDLGGHPILGTRDDEYRDGLRSMAEDALMAARAARIEGGRDDK